MSGFILAGSPMIPNAGSYARMRTCFIFMLERGGRGIWGFGVQGLELRLTLEAMMPNAGSYARFAPVIFLF